MVPMRSDDEGDECERSILHEDAVSPLGRPIIFRLFLSELL